ncbi:hypothetical protein VNO78_20696 [Psophocarpus tetragonolobus]|uniref:Uncharacterized protein n=1 Tax=Psophocarpus tetragonolobus TaxID=3891 RepID=A0AAN9SBF1_PSOTE
MMSLKKRGVGERAWNVVRVSLMWARKGGVLRRRVAMELRLVPKYLKSLGHTRERSHIDYLERELSFDKTPIFHVKMYRPSSMRFHLPHIPCINPHVDFNEYDHEYEGCQDRACSEEEGIDTRAEEFIAKFYHQIRLQRQISLLQYNETPTSDNTC